MATAHRMPFRLAAMAWSGEYDFTAHKYLDDPLDLPGGDERVVGRRTWEDYLIERAGSLTVARSGAN